MSTIEPDLLDTIIDALLTWFAEQEDLYYHPFDMTHMDEVLKPQTRAVEIDEQGWFVSCDEYAFGCTNCER